MKAIFEPIDNQKILNQLEEIAKYYQTEVIQHDTDESHFIFVRSRIKITEEKRNNETRIFVSGANESDIVYLKQFWGKPIEIVTEKMTPMDFVKEVVNISNIENLKKEELINLLEINEKEFDQYLRYMKRIAKRANAPSNVVKVALIL